MCHRPHVQSRRDAHKPGYRARRRNTRGRYGSSPCSHRRPHGRVEDDASETGKSRDRGSEIATLAESQAEAPIPPYATLQTAHTIVHSTSTNRHAGKGLVPSYRSCSRKPGARRRHFGGLSRHGPVKGKRRGHKTPYQQSCRKTLSHAAQYFLQRGVSRGANRRMLPRREGGEVIPRDARAEGLKYN